MTHPTGDALKASAAQVVPPGYVLVPIKPTKEMAYQAACYFYGKRLVDTAGGIDGISMANREGDRSFWFAFKKIWRAALANAPQPIAALSPVEQAPQPVAVETHVDVEDIREQRLATIVAPDNGTPREVMFAVLECAKAWVPEARIIGNVRAGDIARSIEALNPELAPAAPTEAFPVESHEAEPDYCFDPEEWEFTCHWSDRDEVHGHGESLNRRDPMRVCTLMKGPDKWVADVPITWDENGDPDDTEIKWFDSEEEARAALAAEGSAE
jgi:hypothetical protein